MDATEHAEVTHGFLFADLRGYTQLVDTRGAAEASRLLERYRALTREVVAGNGGAEIKTEGDSFYVVLPSASAAVRCGLALVAACAAPDDGGPPIAVGVGIHAGESVAHEGGFVGSAVNIAARICASAAAGELLASATIRDLTRSVAAARFESIGRRTLKGLAEPVELFRVVPEGAPPAARRVTATRVRARPAALGILGLALVALAIVGLGGVILAIQGRAGAPTLAPSSAPASSSAVGPSGSPALKPLPRVPTDQSVENPIVPPGTYAPNVNADVASVTISEGGWKLDADAPDVLVFEYGSEASAPYYRGGTGAVAVVRVQVVFKGACPDAGTRVLGDRPQDLIAWIQSTPQLEASAPRSVNDLGLSGIAIDAEIVPPPAEGCGGRDESGTSLWQQGGDPWIEHAGTHLRIEALSDRAGRTLTVVMASWRTTELSNFALGPGGELLRSIVLR